MSQLRVKQEIRPTMNCRDAELMILDFITKHQPSDIPAELSEHLSVCDLCSRLYIRSNPDFKALLAGRRTAPDPDFYNKLSFRLKTASGPPIQYRKPLLRFIHYSPAFFTAAASVILGVWLGSKWFILTQGGVDSGYPISDLDRSGMVEAFASELHLADEATLALESYFSENENTGNYDTK